MSVTLRFGIVLAIFVLALLLIKKAGLLGSRGRGRPLDINDPPATVPTVNLGKSASGPARPANKSSRTVFFLTENTTIEPMLGGVTAPKPVLTRGEGHESPASGLFEMHVYFSVHNWSGRMVSIHDIRAKLYHVSAGYVPLAIGYVNRFRVDLAEDNSILKTGSVIRVSHGSAAHVDLAFETGFYGDTGTTLAVFGLEVDLQLSGDDGVSMWRLPSEKVYVLQHSGPPFSEGSEAHFGSMDAAYINSCYEREKSKTYLMPDTAAAQTMDRAVLYECIGRMLAIHSAAGFHEITA